MIAKKCSRCTVGFLGEHPRDVPELCSYCEHPGLRSLVNAAAEAEERLGSDVLEDHAARGRR